MKKQTQNRVMDTGEREREGEMYIESNMEAYVTIANGNCHVTQRTQTGAL